MYSVSNMERYFRVGELENTSHGMLLQGVAQRKESDCVKQMASVTLD